MRVRDRPLFGRARNLSRSNAKTCHFISCFCSAELLSLIRIVSWLNIAFTFRYAYQLFHQSIQPPTWLAPPLDKRPVRIDLLTDSSTVRDLSTSSLRFILHYSGPLRLGWGCLFSSDFLIQLVPDHFSFFVNRQNETDKSKWIYHRTTFNMITTRKRIRIIRTRLGLSCRR